MTEPFRLACVQLNAGNDMKGNIAVATELIRDAVRDGADFVALPECSVMMEVGRKNVLDRALPEENHPALETFQEVAAALGVWLLPGTLTVRLRDERVANRGYLIDPEGEIRARYDKIHMFDVDLEGGESYRESATYRAGASACVAETPWGLMGFTVCYDVRFPHLYRQLAQAGAIFTAVPSAFTQPTGRAHWHVLMRARAIETGSYIFAPAQCGEHPRGRRTYGHSLIVDPWGEVLADGGESPGVIVAEIDPARVASVRRSLPSLTHDRPYAAPSVPQPRHLRAAGD
jgi:predicted amidohydrolase